MDQTTMTKKKPAKQKARDHEVLTDALEIKVPWRHVKGMRAPRTLRIPLLTHRQGLALRCLMDALDSEGELVRLNRMRPVKCHTDAVRWILDLIADTAGVPVGYPVVPYEG